MKSIRHIRVILAATLMVISFAGAPAIAQQDEAAVLTTKVAELYKAGKFADAIPLAQQALVTREKALGPDHPDVARSLRDLAELYRAQDRYFDAEPLLKRALAIRERVLGPDHPDVARSLRDLAELYRAQADVYNVQVALFRRRAALEASARDS